MKTMHKMLIRDLWNFKIRGLLVISLVAISVALFGSLVLLQTNVYAARDNTYRSLNYEDIAVRTLAFLPEQNLKQNLLKADSNIQSLATRLTVDATVTADGESFDGVVHGINATSYPSVNSFQLLQGELLHSANDVLIESHFAKAHNISPGNMITVFIDNQNITVHVSGVVFSPEYKYVINPKTGLPESKSFCALWTSLMTVQQLLNMSNSINEIFFLLKDKSMINRSISLIGTFIQKNYQIPFSILKGAEESDHITMEEDIQVLVNFSLAFSGILLLVVAYTLFETLNKVIISQKTIIGVLRSLGASKKDAILHYIKFSLVLLGSGIILGLIIGFYLSAWFSEQYINLVGFINFTTVFKLEAFYEAIFLVLVVGIGSTILSTYKISSITPKEALSGFEENNEFHSNRFIEFFSKIISKKNQYSFRIPLRNIFNRKKRTFYTAFAIALSLLLVLTSNGALNSAFHQIDTYFDTNIKYDLEVQLDHPMNFNNTKQLFSSLNGVQNITGFIKMPAIINSSSITKSIYFSAYSINTTIRNYHFSEGSLQPGKIILGKTLAKNLKVGIGDIVTLKTAIGNNSFITTKDFEISGIISELFDQEAYLTLQTAQEYLGIDKNITTLAINTGGNLQNLKDTILHLNIGISYIQDMQQTKSSFRDLLEGMITIVNSINIIGLVILIIFSLNTLVMDILEREREFINLRVGGANVLKISKIIVLQIFFIICISLIFVFPLAQYTTDYLNTTVTSDFMTVVTYIEPITYILGLFILVIGLSFGTMVAIRQVFQIKLLFATRIRFTT